MTNGSVPKPCAARLEPNSSPQEWLEQAKLNRFLPEHIMKQLCEKTKEALMEGEWQAVSIYT